MIASVVDMQAQTQMHGHASTHVLSFTDTHGGPSYYLNVVVLMVITVVENGLITFGRSLFHCCTCLERNLVVVHPVA